MLLQNLIKNYRVAGNEYNYRLMEDVKLYFPNCKIEMKILKCIFQEYKKGESSISIIPVVNEKYSGLKSYRFFVAIDCTDAPISEIITKITQILKKMFLNVNTRYRILQRKDGLKKYHIYFPEIVVTNKIHQCLNFLISKQIGRNLIFKVKGLRFPFSKDYVDGNYVEGGEYVPIDKEKITQKEFLTDFNIRRKGKLPQFSNSFKTILESFVSIENRDLEKERIFNGRRSKRYPYKVFQDLSTEWKTFLKMVMKQPEIKRLKPSFYVQIDQYCVLLKTENDICDVIERRHKYNRHILRCFLDSRCVYRSCMDHKCGKWNVKIFEDESSCES